MTDNSNGQSQRAAIVVVYMGPLLDHRLLISHTDLHTKIEQKTKKKHDPTLQQQYTIRVTTFPWANLVLAPAAGTRLGPVPGDLPWFSPHLSPLLVPPCRALVWTVEKLSIWANYFMQSSLSHHDSGSILTHLTGSSLFSGSNSSLTDKIVIKSNYPQHFGNKKCFFSFFNQNVKHCSLIPYINQREARTVISGIYIVFKSRS